MLQAIVSHVHTDVSLTHTHTAAINRFINLLCERSTNRRRKPKGNKRPCRRCDNAICLRFDYCKIQHIFAVVVVDCLFVCLSLICSLSSTTQPDSVDIIGLFSIQFIHSHRRRNALLSQICMYTE